MAFFKANIVLAIFLLVVLMVLVKIYSKGDQMSNSGMLDNYLIAQALGWDWNFWTMITITGIEIGIFILMVALCGVLCVILDIK